jgi:hypothetical protein
LEIKMPRKTTGTSRGRAQGAPAQVDPKVMLNATLRANPGRAQAFFFGGNIGDSIERRFNGNGFGGDALLGGGSDIWHGFYGNNSSYPAVNYGNYFGGGPGYGPGS